MKFTNVKQLIIKFMGGGLINFPTRFLRWVKINGDTDDSDDGGGSDSYVFFVPATIQPKYFVNGGGTEPIEIKNYTSNNYTVFLYNKEDIISLGVNEEDLNNLDSVELNEAFDDFYTNNGDNGYLIQGIAFKQKIILKEINTNSPTIPIYSELTNACLYKISDDVFLILQITPNAPE